MLTPLGSVIPNMGPKSPMPPESLSANSENLLKFALPTRDERACLGSRQEGSGLAKLPPLLFRWCRRHDERNLRCVLLSRIKPKIQLNIQKAKTQQTVPSLMLEIALRDVEPLAMDPL